jgi:hypothetical protein
MTRRDDLMRRATLEGFAIVGPVSPWDAKHTDAIRLDNAKSTFGQTAGEAWSRQIREYGAGFDPLERSRRIQHWHDRGYRLVKATLTIDALIAQEDAAPMTPLIDRGMHE